MAERESIVGDRQIVIQHKRKRERQAERGRKNDS